ncbi:hypothetical protein PJ311_03805 [Bacillus sp. CLL-7-23]|uniref:Uncharacterized protein n=1 Tax=Bacillus changyiensis TaxID=3004103 RepID=A0ABT4X0W5_9BACI|nr:hypothetical protein [Bacillus changyiensis]MDA7025737.1 hypothetical protein [Bacillus changyiensis]
MNSEHFQMIQKALEELSSLDGSAKVQLTYAKENLAHAISHLQSTDHPFLPYSIDWK